MAIRGKVDQRSDRELVRLCNTGDADAAARAFEALYERHKDYVLRIAFRFVRDGDAALDVLQEAQHNLSLLGEAQRDINEDFDDPPLVEIVGR